MKQCYFHWLYFLFLLTSLSNCAEKELKKSERHLFPVFTNERFGFIDSTGKMIIEPKFLSAGEFAEGLAPARITGKYGYIDEKGNFVIEPSFDYAASFSEGLALVYIDGNPFFINAKGRKVFDCHFHAVEKFINGRALVKTKTKKYGYINQEGKLFIDTVFSGMGDFEDGVAVVWGENSRTKTEVGVIDTLGNFLVPYGKFERISDYHQGHFLASIPPEPWDTITGTTGKTAIIDRTGRIIVSQSRKNQYALAGNFREGLAKMYLYKYWIPEQEGVISSSDKSYEGYMNSKGVIVINDTSYKYVEEFSCKRAFVRDNNDHYYIIDTKGKRVGNKMFDRVLGSGFKRGVAFVNVDWKWGLIDTNGRYIIEPHLEQIDQIGITEEGFFFYHEHNYKKMKDLAGIAKIDRSIVLKPIMDDYDREGFKFGLLQCSINGKLSYVNKKGAIVWQQSQEEISSLRLLNVDYMTRGYFLANSLPEKEPERGGWYNSPNIPRKIDRKSKVDVGFGVYVDTLSRDTFENRYNGHRVLVLNNGNTPISFEVQDSRLYMKVQALDQKDQWKDIEYLPNSWCGNSYHTIELKPGYFWEFVTPVYQGDYKTKLRVELAYIDPADKSGNLWNRKQKKLYSNVYEASINPGQFWRKSDYTPGGLMDPYTE